ncbi:MAG: SurA N-terminal domain-containing protein [Candidatus Omnitrophica bacterium]|nr:SurA N-terminal domain-containing protein [Candidatus Omnitrophota bacterium]
MLKFFRKNIKAIIWVIVLAFIAWGAGTLTVSKSDDSLYVGSVGNEKISQKEFLMMRRYYELLSRAKAEPAVEPLSTEELHALAWQAIILSRQASEEGITVGDNEVRSQIEQLFSVDGRFQPELYQAWIRQNYRASARDFEEAVRKQIISQKIREKILADLPEEKREERWVSWFGEVIRKSKVKDYEVANRE